MEEEKKEFDKWKKGKASWSRKLTSNINAWHIVLFFLLIVGGAWMMTTGKVKPGFFYAGLILAVFLILFFSWKEVPGKTLIPEHIIKQICQDALEAKRRKGIEIRFDEEVRVMLAGEPKYEQDLTNDTSGIVRRNVGFEVSRKGYTRKGLIGVHPYSGEIMGFEFLAIGYTGRESRETIKIVPVGTFDTKNPIL